MSAVGVEGKWLTTHWLRTRLRVVVGSKPTPNKDTER